MKNLLNISPTFVCAIALAMPIVSHAQNSEPAPPPAPQQQPTPDAPQPQADEPTPPKGTVLFQSHGEPPKAADEAPAQAAPQVLDEEAAAKLKDPKLSDAERGALTFTAYDLDARLTPAARGLTMRAALTVRNDGSAPLSRIALQISSTLHWEAATLFTATGAVKLPLAQHLLDTDADHTGKANEAILTLPEPLAPGASVRIDTFYSGAIAESTGRLERIGASPAQAIDADWDAIAPQATALRGFGNVLWYPIAAPQLFLGQGAELFQAIGRTRLREATATVRLRVAVEYHGEAPAAVYFCGRRADLKAIADDPEMPVASGSGIATAEFATEPLGFRELSLFVVNHAETFVAPLPSAPKAVEVAPAPSSSSSSSSSEEASAAGVSASSGAVGPPMIAAETEDEASLTPLAASAQTIAPLIEQWFGPRPLSALTVIDQQGQPFEDGPLLAAPVAALGAPGASPALAHSLTHAWVDSGEPWMDEGLAQFASLLWVERQKGRDTAVSQLQSLLQPLALAEPSFTNAAEAHAADAPAGQPLIAATNEVFFRRKAAAVWWMLRGIIGERPLQESLAVWRMEPATKDFTPAGSAAAAIALEKVLEQFSHRDLAWFFDDWVLHDRGLPDLTITDVTPRALPAGQGHDSGWLVAVTVRNEGAARAEVPIIIRSGTFSTTRRMLVPAFGEVTDRVLVESPPTQVEVNDGSTPEVRTSLHTRTLVVKTER